MGKWWTDKGSILERAEFIQQFVLQHAVISDRILEEAVKEM